MMRWSFVPFLLAGAVSVVAADFIISLDGGVTTTKFMDVIQFGQSDAVTACQSNCTQPIQLMTTCNQGANDASCFCDQTLASSLVDCEQCMLNFLVAHNEKQPNKFVGANTPLAGLVGACSNTTLAKPLQKNITTLAIAPNWDGPFGQGLDTPATAIVVFTGFLLGASALYIFSTIDVPNS